MSRNYIQSQKFTLSVGISTTDTSIILESFTFPDGTAIASGDLGAINYGTLEAGSSREEQISFTGITNNADGTVTLTGVTRGLGFGATDTYSEQSDLKVQHGAGAQFILSNTAGFYNDFVNKYNDETISGTLSVPVPTSGTHAATKQYVDDTVNGGAVSNDRIVQAGIAGESVAAGDLVYFDDTDNEWKKTDATSAATINNVLIGIAQGSGSDGGQISGGVLTYGLDSNQTGLTVGVKVYASDTAGAIAESAGTVEKVIGWTKSATEIYFDANVDTLPTANEKDALAGSGNTPDATNTFVTTDDLSDPTFKPPQVVTFTSSGTWTKDAGLKYVIVEVQGAGGGGGRGDGGASDDNGGSGGGAGGYSRKLILASSLGATETVTVGTGGAGDSGSGGATGGNSSFGAHATANGGTGANGSEIEGVGGTAASGDVNSQGQHGSRGTEVGEKGAGGANALGWGVGGGGNGGNGSDNGSGGNNGIVIVTEYYS